MELTKHILSELTQLTKDPLKSSFLLAVSGGKDSMVLLDCFQKLDLDFKVAHFNYQLRGIESDGDEMLVKQVCEENNISLFCNTEDTNQFATIHKLSIQEAARKLRYEWFTSLLEKENLQWIVTAHHANDTIETFFINLLRGSGIQGLSGIPQKNGNIVRPLLTVPRNEIDHYALKYKVRYRNDSSNATLKYKRNFIRHKIVPKLQEIDNNASNAIIHSIDLLGQANNYLQKKLNEDINKLVTEKNNNVIINTSNSIDSIVFFNIIQKFGFNANQASNIQNAINNVGAIFQSATHKLLIDRNQILITPDQQAESDIFIISSIGKYLQPFSISFEIQEIPTTFASKKNTVFLDAEKLIFPLEIRKWKEGDWFIPLGMKGKKKLSDFFIDNKISRFEKNNIWLLVSNDKIVWIINHRLDDRFKITSSTKKVICVVTEK